MMGFSAEAAQVFFLSKSHAYWSRLGFNLENEFRQDGLTRAGEPGAGPTSVKISVEINVKVTLMGRNQYETHSHGPK